MGTLKKNAHVVVVLFGKHFFFKKKTSLTSTVMWLPEVTGVFVKIPNSKRRKKKNKKTYD